MYVVLCTRKQIDRNQSPGKDGRSSGSDAEMAANARLAKAGAPVDEAHRRSHRCEAILTDEVGLDRGEGTEKGMGGSPHGERRILGSIWI